MEYINQKLEESREMQRKNGGKHYTNASNKKD